MIWNLVVFNAIQIEETNSNNVRSILTDNILSAIIMQGADKCNQF